LSCSDYVVDEIPQTNKDYEHIVESKKPDTSDKNFRGLVRIEVEDAKKAREVIIIPIYLFGCSMITLVF